VKHLRNKVQNICDVVQHDRHANEVRERSTVAIVGTDSLRHFSVTRLLWSRGLDTTDSPVTIRAEQRTLLLRQTGRQTVLRSTLRLDRQVRIACENNQHIDFHHAKTRRVRRVLLNPMGIQHERICQS
jgi:hypothetical protein